MAFLAAEFGHGIHERLLRSGSSTFNQALANGTKPYSQRELLGPFPMSFASLTISVH
jgi:hypothetical protein